MKYALNAMQGQHNDLENFPETEDECLQMIKQKSGSLTAMSAVLGTMLANGEFNEEIENDYYGLFNKNRSDIRKGRKTLILLYLKRRFNAASEKILDLMNAEASYHSFLIDNKKSLEDLLFDAGVSQYVSMLIKMYEEEITTSIKDLNIMLEL